MNEPITELNKELRAVERVSLVIAEEKNRGKRNAYLFIGIIIAAVVLFFSWNKWLIALPALLGIAALLHQMNIVIINSELKRRSRELQSASGLLPPIP